VIVENIAVTQKSFKIIRIYTAELGVCKFLLIFYCNYVSLVYRLWDSLRCALEIWVRSYTTSYLSTIVSIALSCTIVKLFDVEGYRDLEGHSRSQKCRNLIDRIWVPICLPL